MSLPIVTIQLDAEESLFTLCALKGKSEEYQELIDRFPDMQIWQDLKNIVDTTKRKIDQARAEQLPKHDIDNLLNDDCEVNNAS